MRFNLIILILVFNNKKSICSDCNYDQPIKRNNGECIEGGCSKDEFKSRICKIENDFIRKQWLTSIIHFSEKGTVYTTLATTPKGNLICISSYYSSSTINYFYGLKKNGRSYFSKNGKETYFESINSNKARNEGNIYAINLNGEDDKEYIITFGKNEAFFELYNFCT